MKRCIANVLLNTGVFMDETTQIILSKIARLEDRLDEARESSAEMRALLGGSHTQNERIQEEISKIADIIDRQTVLLSDYNRQLEIHIKRTNLLEEKVWPIVEAKMQEETVKNWQKAKNKRLMTIIATVSGIAGLIGILADLYLKVHK